jgi:hypothetical protein
MRKPLALVLTICVGALAVGCEEAKKPETKVPTSDLGKAGTPPKETTTSPPTTTPPAKKATP